MAYRTTHIIESVLWQPERSAFSGDLTASIRDLFTAQRSYFNDIVKLDDTAPSTALTLASWSRPAALSSLMNSYADHIYRNQPALDRENKPLKSLWAQWYIGLLVPPVLLALLTLPQALAISPNHVHVEFHETGRAARFWIDVQEDSLATQLDRRQRLEQFVVNGIAPIVNALAASGDINARLIWSNTGYLINWFLGEIRELIGDEAASELRQACFFEKRWLNGEDNPLYRTVVLRDGMLVRRTCCQRYRLPDVMQCGDCSLK